MKTKIFSILAAVLLVLGSLLPTLVTVAEGESPHQTDIVIHKIKMTSLVGWPKEKIRMERTLEIIIKTITVKKLMTSVNILVVNQAPRSLTVLALLTGK